MPTDPAIPSPELDEAEAGSVSSHRLARATDWLPLLAMLGGVILLFYLLRFPSPHVHFSTDGALKEYIIRMWLGEGTLSSRLIWTGAADWQISLWEAGRFPFEAPFLFEGRVVFPPLFLLISMPFYVVFGYHGLFVLPCLSVVGLWIVVLLYLNDRGLGGWPAFVALTLLVASPLTVYGAMFWEHGPGLFCLMTALWLGSSVRPSPVRASLVKNPDVAQPPSAVLDSKKTRKNPFHPVKLGIAGVALVLAVALRPELAAASAVLLVYLLRYVRPWKPLVIGIAVTLVAWIAINLISTGHPLGIHGRQPLYLSDGRWLGKLGVYYAQVARDFLRGCPEVIAVLAMCALVLPLMKSRRRETVLLIVMAAATLAVLPFMIPNFGGFQIFRRFELILIPLSALLAAHLTRYRPWLGILLLGFVLIEAGGKRIMIEEYQAAYGDRMRPLYDRIDRDRPSAIFTNSQYIPIEMSWWLPEIPFLRAETLAELKDLIREAAEWIEPADALIVLFEFPDRSPISITLDDGRALIAAPEAIPFNPLVIYEIAESPGEEGGG